ncbi:MAG: hypothetical protein U0401_03010 [Anaerolineae bacterium]
MAAALGTPIATISGGVATVLLTMGVAWKYPQLLHYRQGVDPNPG